VRFCSSQEALPLLLLVCELPCHETNPFFEGRDLACGRRQHLGALGDLRLSKQQESARVSSDQEQ
jgi:hypothetical protein